jgi:LytTr DNA-binding domain
MLPIRGKRAVLFRVVAIPVAALLASHFVGYRRFPWEPDYQFPTTYFLTIATIMLACWEVNLLVFKWLDHTMPFRGNPLRRIRWQVLVGGILTALTFAVVFSLISWLNYGQFPSFTAFTTGLFICFGIATVINGVYVALYLLDVIYGQKAATDDQLNARLAEVLPAEKEHTDKEGTNHDADRELFLQEVAFSADMLIETGSSVQRLRANEIAYFYSAGGLVQLIRADGRRVTTNYDSFAALDGRLVPAQFFQISRQFIVQLNAVRSVQDDVNRKLQITLMPGLTPNQPTETVIISRYRSAEFRRWLMATTKPGPTA